jgi:hypothetical protein
MVFEQYGCLCPNCCFCTSVTADACIQGGERVWQPKVMSSRCAFGRAKGGGKKLCRSRPKQQTHAKAASASVAVPAGRGKGLPPGTEIPKLTQPSKKEKETTKDSMVDTMRAAAATAEKRGVGSLSNARNNLHADDGLFHQLGLSERPAPCPNSTRSVSGTPHSRKLQNAVKARVAAEPKNAGRQSGGCNYLRDCDRDPGFDSSRSVHAGCTLLGALIIYPSRSHALPWSATASLRSTSRRSKLATAESSRCDRIDPLPPEPFDFA